MSALSGKRRRAARFSTSLLGAVRKDGVLGGTFYSRDIGPTGLFLVTHRSHEVGEEIQIAIQEPSAWNRLSGHGRVVRVEPLSNGAYGVAVQFDLFPWKSAWNEESFTNHTGLSRLRMHLEENLAQKLSLSSASRVAGMEATYLSSVFHAKIGITFRDWVRHVRITQAMGLLAEKEISVKEVAAAVGYQDLRTFCRGFKHVSGLTPRAFKNVMRPEIRQELLERFRAQVLERLESAPSAAILLSEIAGQDLTLRGSVAAYPVR